MNNKNVEDIFEQKHNLWNKKLLDLSKRNRLLNYKPLKSGSYQICEPMESIFNLLYAGKKITYDISYYSDDDNTIKERTKKLERIRKIIKSADDEMGFNIGYIAFGFLKWYELDNNTKELSSPLVLMPIEINRDKLSSPFTITIKPDEEITINPVITKKLYDDFGISLDNDIEITNITETLENIKQLVSNTSWKIENEVIIDTFNFQNLVIQKDLELNKNKIRNNKFIKALSGINDESTDELYKTYNQDINLKNEKPNLRLQILDADSSQQEAISRARRGDSFVLQGPPGTGKSQTISNIIGEQLGLGKKILFVSEKQAALEVVYNKLKEKNLSEFVLSLHNTKQKKGDIRNQLKQSLELSSKQVIIDKKNYTTYNDYSNTSDFLNSYDEIVHDNNNLYNKSFFDIQGILSKVINSEDLLFNVDKDLLTIDGDQYDTLFQRVEEFLNSYITTTYHHKNNGFKFLKGDMTLSKKSEINKITNELNNDFIIFKSKKQELSDSFEYNTSLKDLKSIIENLEPILSNNLEYQNPNWIDLDLVIIKNHIENIAELKKTAKVLKDNIDSSKNLINETFEEEFYQTEDVDKIIKILKYEYKSFFKRLFSSEYKDIFKKNKRLTKQLKLNYEELITNFERLSTYNQKDNELNLTLTDIKNKETNLYNFLRITSDHIDLNKIYKQITNLIKIKSLVYKDNTWLVPQTNIKNILKYNNISWSEILSKIDILENIQKRILDNTGIFKEHFNGFEEAKFIDILKYLNSLDFNTEQEYFTYKRLKEALIKDYKLTNFINLIEEKEYQNYELLNIFKKRFLILVLDNNEDYKKIDYISSTELNEKVKQFAISDKKTFDLSRDRIIKELVDRLPSINENISMSGGEIQTLKRELSKKSRLMSTRKLIQNLPNLLPRLKPCMMMSPLTVSTYFASNSDWDFDLVIFDEASQVKPEYAIAAISRGKQIIVAGDSKQMPPTSFFDSSTEDDDDENEIQDLESILDELSVKIPETYLNWHYRSKDESLITFSNKKFYNNRLCTFPADNLNIHSNVKFSYIENGIWESKHGNQIEADNVVKLVCEYAKKYPNKSLGIVAFGMSQARVIEDKLLEVRSQNKDLDEYFDENKKEPFFIKNLENVQGDERDLIILSVGYGKTPEGKLRMNFGPLTQSGGERRLNVAVSRAREIMHVVSSIHGSDISIENTTNENRTHFRDFLEFAEKGVSALIGFEAADNAKAVEFDSDFEENVYDFLINKGYKVHTQIGASGYKIDLAIIHPTMSGRYVLAIECDGAAYHSSRTARDRDRLRQEILESKGWKFYRIWSTTWIQDNINEKQRLIEAIENAINNYDNNSSNNQSFKIEGKSSTNLIVQEKEDNCSLPKYNGDVYAFEQDIEQLAIILIPVLKSYEGYQLDDLMKYINKKIFDKARLTKGYKEVYNKAFNYLQKINKIEINNNMIARVY